MVRLHDIMTVDVLTVGPETTLREAAELLFDEHVSGVPVVAGDEVVGVVSATDILDFVSSEPGVPTGRPEAVEWGEWPETEGSAGEGEESPGAFFVDYWSDVSPYVRERLGSPEGPEWNFLEEHTVGEIMSRNVLALGPQTEVREAAKRMLRTGVHRLLVVEDGHLVGVVTTTDIVKAVAQHGLGG